MKRGAACTRPDSRVQQRIAKRVTAKLQKAHALLASVGFYLDDRASADEIDYLNSLVRDSADGEESSFADMLAEASETIMRLVDAAERG